jgi:CHAD domain-containing protein
MASSLQKYFNLCVKNLFNNLNDFELLGNETPLHDFRVEMKKLKAIVKFLKSIYPKQKFKKTSHILGNIFQHAGEIREYQLLLQWLQKYELTHLIEVYFPEEKMIEMIDSFRQKSSVYKDGMKEVVDHCSKFIHKTNAILPEQYLADLKAQMDKKVHKDLNIIEWHELRKLAKQWMYATNWISEENTKRDQLFPFYNKLQETIGYWHDLQFIKDNFSQKQIFLSSDLDVHKDFSIAWNKLDLAIRYRERQVEEILSHNATEYV